MSENNGHSSNKALRWKQNRQVIENVAFPSGATADIRRVDAIAMISEDGNIPDTFYSVMVEAEANGGKMPDMEAGAAKEFMQTLMYVTRNAAKAAFVSPTIVDNPDYDADQISVDDLTTQDRMFLWSWLTGGGEPADALRRFLAQQAGSVVASSSMPSVLPASKQSNGNNG